MFVKGWLAFLTFFWFATAPAAAGFWVFVRLPCVAVDTDWFRGCSEYNHIRYNGSLLTCTHACVPDLDYSCYRYEWEQEPCLVFSQAAYGKCYKGVCYSDAEYRKLAAMKAPDTRMPCKHGNDYLYNNWGPLGCHFYCRERPHDIAMRPDGNDCQNPATARQGGCSKGACYLGYQRS
ncbi:uncharacterized protein LOC135375114 [Ornithodoros turicata]|uniref:uncharacterized protein LOC135375114 n=1 Tax=Ornithodoros turicata TaxID=34597 RepID=UPI003138626B